MQVLIKVVLSVVIILAATAIAKRFPSAAGLLAVMPLTSALVLIWIYIEHKGNPDVMQAFAKGALWGILPTVLFYLVALLCFRKQVSFALVLCSSFGVWFIAALVHQWVLRSR
jgi:uncharacterized membrane protein (GlpM family)